jgi:hypothetical protein
MNDHLYYNTISNDSYALRYDTFLRIGFPWIATIGIEHEYEPNCAPDRHLVVSIPLYIIHQEAKYLLISNVAGRECKPFFFGRSKCSLSLRKITFGISLEEFNIHGNSSKLPDQQSQERRHQVDQQLLGKLQF